MARLVVTDRAHLDISEIIEMLKTNAGTEVAGRYHHDFDVVFDRLAMFPRSGALRPQLGRDMRIAVIKPYVIFYDYRQDDVVVLRVLDGRRKIGLRLVRE
jgi:toxin ParE1/3/4